MLNDDEIAVLAFPQGNGMETPKSKYSKWFDAAFPRFQTLRKRKRKR
jgi:hypothetical protein